MMSLSHEVSYNKQICGVAVLWCTLSVCVIACVTTVVSLCCGVRYYSGVIVLLRALQHWCHCVIACVTTKL